MARKRLVIVILVITVVAIFLTRSSQNGKTFEESIVEFGEVREELVLTGEVKALDSANLQFNTSGKVAWVGVKVGDQVKKGQALMKLDTTKLSSAYQIAAANYRAAEANAQEVLDDVKGNDSDETFEQKNDRTAAETARDKAWDTLLSAQKDLDEATLVAPFDGIASILNSESSGVNVTAGTVQIVLVNPETIYFLVNADQTEVSTFSVGDNAEIALDAFDGENIQGAVSDVSIAPNPAESGTVYPIRVSFNADNSTNKYKLGMTGDVKFILSSKDNVLYAPSKYVKTDREGKYLLTNGGADKIRVETGIESEDRVEILSGISEGTKIYY